MDIVKYTAEMLEQLKKNDCQLKVLIEKVGFIEREINTNLFEALIQQIIAQQVSKQAAITVFDRLKGKVEVVDEISINNLSIEDIQSCGMTFKKAANIKEIARLINNKEFDLNSLKNLNDEEVILEMIKLPGIGVWSAEMFLLFSLERENIISYGDLAIRKGMMKLYNLDSLTKKEFIEYKKNYEPYASVASLYLWHLAHNDLEK